MNLLKYILEHTGENSTDHGKATLKVSMDFQLIAEPNEKRNFYRNLFKDLVERKLHSTSFEQKRLNSQTSHGKATIMVCLDSQLIAEPDKLRLLRRNLFEMKY